MPRHRQTAVARNRVKRSLRELLRGIVLPTLRDRAPLDVVVRAWPEAFEATFDQLRDDVVRVQSRLQGVS